MISLLRNGSKKENESFTTRASLVYSFTRNTNYIAKHNASIKPRTNKSDWKKLWPKEKETYKFSKNKTRQLIEELGCEKEATILRCLSQKSQTASSNDVLNSA